MIRDGIDGKNVSVRLRHGIGRSLRGHACEPPRHEGFGPRAQRAGGCMKKIKYEYKIKNYATFVVE